MRASKVFQTFLLASVAIVAPASGCSCPTNITTSSSLMNHNVAAKVFILRELGNRSNTTNTTEAPIEVPIEEPTEIYSRYFRAYLGDAFKGLNETGKFIVKTNNDGAFCGVDLEERQSYLLFGTIENEKVPGYIGEIPTMSVGLCSGNKQWWKLDDDDHDLLRTYNGTNACRPSDCVQWAKPNCPVGQPGCYVACDYYDVDGDETTVGCDWNVR